MLTQYSKCKIITFHLHYLIENEQEIYQLGCRNIVVAGLPPVGCLPIQETVSFENPLHRICLEDQNSDSKSYNQKLSKLLSNLQPQLPGSTMLYADIYTPLIDMINNPHQYGKLVPIEIEKFINLKDLTS